MLPSMRSLFCIAALSVGAAVADTAAAETAAADADIEQPPATESAGAMQQ